MEAVSPQKIKLLKLYEMLRQHTDEDRPLSTNQLCAMLEEEGITCDRRTLAEDIDILNANGFEVLRRRTRYAMLFYIVDRRFDFAEVKILIDAIQAASFITPQKTKELTDKVASLAGSHKAAVLKEHLVTFNTRKHTNEAIFYTVDTLQRALQQKQKASFQYFDLDENGNRVLRKKSERYVVNPVGLVYHEDNYYFVTYHETHEATVNYRVDRMANAQVEEEPVAEQAIALSDELGAYTERVFKMFNGPQATVELQFDRNSKGEMTGKQSKDAIVSVFLKVFNEMQGFCGSMPFLADLERKLSEEGLYDTFQSRFEIALGSPWKEARNDFDFIQDDVVDVLSDMEFMSVEAARNWCEKAAEPYPISIERFAQLVKAYIDKKGKNHHVVFLVDEIGQYIGDDSKLMLNLQTVTEDLGTACKGKAWIIVTSQQDIDSITKTKGNDFSKIQGRFDTRLSLSSANVDDVIRKRILEKTDTAKETLSLLYDDKATVIKNLIMFNDGIEKKLFSGRDNFAAIYPFVPYQFNLLGSVLTSIRTHGASGKHLAEGERSMIALFKESAMRLMNDAAGKIVPFHMFYDALEQFLDHSHKGVIIKALDNDYLNPNHEQECFDVNVLKTLFMIKYVKEITSNASNITSLMVSDIETDRLELSRKVEDALARLVRQTLVQKVGEVYVFLTDEEQEINRAIEAMSVEITEIIGRVSELIFDGLYDEKKYRYPAFNGRYAFGFNQIVDIRLTLMFTHVLCLELL